MPSIESNESSSSKSARRIENTIQESLWMAYSVQALESNLTELCTNLNELVESGQVFESLNLCFLFQKQEGWILMTNL